MRRLEIDLPFALSRPMLALGGQIKSTIALGWGAARSISPHLGDMDAPRSLALLRSRPRICNRSMASGPRRCAATRTRAMPQRVSRALGLPVTPVFHHAAHASALAAEARDGSR